MKLWVSALFITALAPCHAQEGCPVSKDLVVRALELVSAQAKQSDIEDGLQLLKHAVQICNENGDAWYYRSLFERRLGHAPLADYALGQARTRDSEAMKGADNPFQLATPARGVSVADVKPDIGVRTGSVSHKWALVVGIANFQDEHLKLRYSAADAQAFAALLKDPKFGRFAPDHVKLLEDRQATTVQIKAGLNWLARMAAPEDLAVVYMATHGSAREQDLAGANYVITFDSDVKSYDGLYSTALPMVEISNAIRNRVRARKVAVFLDTCHSAGAIADTVSVTAAVSAATLDHIREGTGRVILAASQTAESSYESPRYGHGLFTYYLLQALKQDEGRMPIDKVYDYVSAHVDADAKANGWKQHPVLSRSDADSSLVIGIATAGLTGGLLKAFPKSDVALSGGTRSNISR